ncbi:methylmalonyl Co-A mutase-associated GTPase MeaB [Acidobacteriota bacterium]
MFNISQEILKGNPRAVARGISLIENKHPDAQKVLRDIFPHTGNSLIIGITGSPGSGKSTLVDQLIGFFIEKGKNIGIIAVDPSSPFSGGAILGDRIRMMRHSTNPNVFIRSMATRGHLGGLSKASGEAISILEASGKDVIIVETVGVGQDEVEVVKLADIVLVVLIAGVGDDIQAFKAGIMEIADVFVLNKADSPDSDRTEGQIKAMLDLGTNKEKIPSVVKTVATAGEGIHSLVEEIETFSCELDQKGRITRKKKLLSLIFKDIVAEKIYQLMSEHIQSEEFEGFIDRIYKKEIDPYTLADEIVDRIKKKSNDQNN